jgi:signal transduction histidine kinase
MIKLVWLILLIATPLTSTFSQTIVSVDSLFEANDMTAQWEYFEEKQAITNYQNLVKINNWSSNKSIPISFSEKVKAVWLRTSFYNKSNSVLPVRIITKGIDSLNTIWTNGSGKINTYLTGKNIHIARRFIASQYLVIPINLAPRQNTIVYVRIYNQAYHLSLPFLRVANPSETNSFMKKGEILYNFYLGGLFLMMLFSIILFTFYREKLYLFYFFCLVWSFSVAFSYNDYIYFFFDELPEFIRNKNVYAFFMCLINISYLLLAEQYLNVDVKGSPKIIKFSRVLMLALMILLVGSIMIGKTLYYYRYYFYPLISINAIITYYHLIVSIRKEYSPSWFFLAATAPIVFISTLDVTSDFNNIPVQTIHDYFYIGTFIEMFFLTMGIVYRFRLERTNLQFLQRELFVAEIKAQDRERERIARDLHDNIGNGILRIKQSLKEFLSQYLEDETTVKTFQKNIDDLDKTYQNVQGLSHELMPQGLIDLGLVEEIKSQYGYTRKPTFKLFLPTTSLNLNPFVELTLLKIINEAVQNIMKHAKATEVGIELSKDDKNLRLRIEDNGIGFDQNQVKKGGIGLKNLKFRAESELNGNLTIESSPGNGTIILLKILLKNIPHRD